MKASNVMKIAMEEFERIEFAIKSANKMESVMKFGMEVIYEKLYGNMN